MHLAAGALAVAVLACSDPGAQAPDARADARPTGPADAGPTGSADAGLPPALYSIAVTVPRSVDGLTLTLNDAEVLVVADAARSASGQVVFETRLPAGAPYDVAVLTAADYCYLRNGRGIVGGPVRDGEVACASARQRIAAAPEPGRVLFAATDGVHGRQLWATDGAVVERVTSLPRGSQDAHPLGLTLFEGHLYFLATNPAGQRMLWRTAGRPGTARALAPLADDGVSAPTLASLHPVGSSLVAWSPDWSRPLVLRGDRVREFDLAGADLTALAPGPFEPTLRAGEGARGDELFFFGFGVGLDDAVRSAIWALDASAATVRFVAPGPTTPGLGFPGVLATEAGVFVVAPGGGSGGRARLSRVDVEPPQVLVSDEVTGMAALGDAVIFGRAGATHRLFAGELAPVRFPVEEAGTVASLGGALVFVAEYRTELWITDGTSAGTRKLSPSSLAGAHSLAATGSFVAFVGEDRAGAEELWISDGTEGGTFPVDLREGPVGSLPRDLTAIAGRVWFSADDGEHGRELWVTDGTIEGTRMVADLRRGPGDGL